MLQISFHFSFLLPFVLLAKFRFLQLLCVLGVCIACVCVVCVCVVCVCVSALFI